MDIVTDPKAGRSLRFLFVNPWYGAIGPNVVLQKVLREVLERRHLVHLVVTRKDLFTTELEDRGAVVHLVPSLHLVPNTRSPVTILRHLRHALLQLARTSQIIRTIRPDLVCINTENQVLMPWSGVLTRTPTVVMVHGARFTRLGAAGKLYFALQWPAVTRYVAVSNTVGKGLQEVGVPSKRVAVICNGVDLSEFSNGASSADFRLTLGVSPGSLLIGTVCHLTRRKGIHNLIEVLRKIVVQVPNVVSLVVGTAREGDEAYHAELLSAVRVFGLESRIRFLGERHDVARILREVDIVIHPSETESFGCAIAEAMASEKPVIGFNVDAVGELIVDGVTGFVVPPFDTNLAASAAVRLLTDAELRYTVGKAARVRALAVYDATKNTRSTVDLLQASVR